jgi:preprotein translocase SecE subunit
MANDSNTPDKAPQTPDTQKKDKNAQETASSKAQNWFHAKYIEYWSEFKKIVWPSRLELFKQTGIVIVVSLIFGAYIAILDGAFSTGFTYFAQFASTLVS